MVEKYEDNVGKETLMIERKHYLSELQKTFEIHPICAVLGPRQCGKTTLAKTYAKTLQTVHFFDLENPQDLALLESPSITLPALNGLIVIDEIQFRPDLFPYLRFLVDNSDKKFLILGSASQDLIRQSSETLAGRVGYVELPPFQLSEVNNMLINWMRGGFPKSFLADSDDKSERWRIDYIRTFLERDMARMGIDISVTNMRRLWNMLAHYHGQLSNVSELARSMDMSHKAVKRYIDILEGCFMIRQLRPWFENISKRQTKSPKIYIRDSGIFHSLLGIASKNIHLHPKCGASWEGYALETIIHHMDNKRTEYYFWRTEKGAELDLLVLQNGQRLGYEFKYSEHPKMTKSMHSAMEDLKLDRLTIITPGTRSYPLGEKVFVESLENTIRAQEKMY